MIRTGAAGLFPLTMLFPIRQRSSEPRRVAITGVGIITSLGAGWKPNAEGFRSGRRAARRVTLFDVSNQRTTQAAEVDLPAGLPPTRLTARQESRMDRAGRMLLIAAHEAWSQAGWRPGQNEAAIALGVTSAGMPLGEDYYRQAAAGTSDCGQASRIIYYQAQRQALDLVDAFGCEGSADIIANACASGANSVGHGFEMIRSGRADKILAGGYDALSCLVFAGFNSLKALSPTTCRPFDASRDGLMLGEGAGVICLESLESAKARGALILGEVAGYGTVTDLHHLTQPQPDGNAAFEAMTLACASAGISPERVQYVNAHGTGTPANDVAEAQAIARWAGAQASKLPVSSTKGSVGHLLGAAGTVEAIACLMAIKEGWLPPELGLETPDAACGFPLVRAPQDADLDCVLTNSFGFGGANASLVLRRFA